MESQIIVQTFVANGINNSGIGSVKEERIVDWRGLLINLNPFP